MEKISKNLLDAVYYAENNPHISHTKIAQIFNVGRHSIAKWLKLDYKKFNIQGLNEYSDFFYYFEPEQLEAIQNYDFCLQYGYSAFKQKYPSIPERKENFNLWLKIFNIDPQSQKRNRYHFNRTAFNSINTEEEAYWLGFILADGCIVDNKRLSINLAEKDKEHLKKFCRFLQMPEKEIEQIIKSSFGGAYTKDNPVSMLNICSQEIVENLKNKNITARKSGKEKPYICSSIELEKAYIRGILDGDGYIRQAQAGFGLVGSKEICEYVQNYINKNITDTSKNHIREHGSIYKLEINGINQTSKILTYFYKEATIYLDRKFKLYNELYCRV